MIKARNDLWRVAMTTTAKHEPSSAEQAAEQESAFVLEQELLSLPRNEIREHGMGGEVAYDLISNELLLDGSARLNLATFVTTKMPPYASRLMAETADKNMIDKDEYPQTAELEKRCVNIIGHLWHA